LGFALAYFAGAFFTRRETLDLAVLSHSLLENRDDRFAVTFSFRLCAR